MIIEGTDIKIPDSLIVDGDLFLSRTKVTKLPDGLTVSGGLDLYGTNITSLPSGLTIGDFFKFTTIQN